MTKPLDKWVKAERKAKRKLGKRLHDIANKYDKGLFHDESLVRELREAFDNAIDCFYGECSEVGLGGKDD
jgi:hypothetical protein